LLAFLTRGWQEMPIRDLFLFMACGLIATIGLSLLTYAYRVAPSFSVAPFEYSFIFRGALLGLALLGSAFHDAGLGRDRHLDRRGASGDPGRGKKTKGPHPKARPDFPVGPGSASYISSSASTAFWSFSFEISFSVTLARPTR
jgi:hypothetical protein